MFNISKLLEAVKNIIEDYADNPALWISQHKPRIINIAKNWGEDDFLGSLWFCCNNGSINFFFKGDAGKWRTAYLKSINQGGVEKPISLRPKNPKPYKTIRERKAEITPEEHKQSKNILSKFKRKIGMEA